MQNVFGKKRKIIFKATSNKNKKSEKSEISNDDEVYYELIKSEHPNELINSLIFNVNDLTRLDATKDAARLAHTVGTRKRKEILAKAANLGIKVLNPGKLPSQTKDRKKKIKSVEQSEAEVENH